jgi:hypothetical protein
MALTTAVISAMGSYYEILVSGIGWSYELLLSMMVLCFQIFISCLVWCVIHPIEMILTAVIFSIVAYLFPGFKAFLWNCFHFTVITILRVGITVEFLFYIVKYFWNILKETYRVIAKIGDNLPFHLISAMLVSHLTNYFLEEVIHYIDGVHYNQCVGLSSYALLTNTGKPCDLLRKWRKWLVEADYASAVRIFLYLWAVGSDVLALWKKGSHPEVVEAAPLGPEAPPGPPPGPEAPPRPEAPPEAPPGPPSGPGAPPGPPPGPGDPPGPPPGPGPASNPASGSSPVTRGRGRPRKNTLYYDSAK